MSEPRKRVLHVGVREVVLKLRDEILRLHGYEVVSTIDLAAAATLFRQQPFDLVVIDVEGPGRVVQAEDLCAQVRTVEPGQKVTFVCNYLVSIESRCPNEILQADFNPAAFVEGVERVLHSA